MSKYCELCTVRDARRRVIERRDGNTVHWYVCGVCASDVALHLPGAELVPA